MVIIDVVEIKLKFRESLQANLTCVLLAKTPVRGNGGVAIGVSQVAETPDHLRRRHKVQRNLVQVRPVSQCNATTTLD